MCDTKFSIYLYSVRVGIRTCAGGHVSLGFSVVGAFKRVFGMGVSLGVLPALFHFASIRFYSVMSLDEPISSGVGPEVQEAIKEALSGLFTNLTSVIESRL